MIKRKCFNQENFLVFWFVLDLKFRTTYNQPQEGVVPYPNRDPVFCTILPWWARGKCLRTSVKIITSVRSKRSDYICICSSFRADFVHR
mmetsp:Transcript_23146/g.34527  ORF Transcript_23146/g.34527 Transcript_23146/m.34527 type:complete len:89 (+) Transcript_23146:874-1140(+)